MKKITVFASGSFLRNISFSCLSFVLFLVASCSKSKEDAAPVSSFVGTYFDTDYDFKIESTGGNTFKITNFGDFLNTALKAEADGAGLKIPSQSFKNSNGNSIIIVGTAVLSTTNKKDDTIKIQYSVSGYTSYTGEIKGIRK